MSDKMSMQEQAEEILRIAQEGGVENNFFFTTTFKRYETQLHVFTELEKTIKKDGMLVSKEYVKGRENVYTHPAIKELTQISAAMDRTVATLIKIIKAFREDQKENTEGKHESKLLRALRGEFSESV